MRDPLLDENPDGLDGCRGVLFALAFEAFAALVILAVVFW